MIYHKKMAFTLIFIVILIILLLIIYLAPKTKPINIIEHKLNLILPSSSKILNFDYNKWNGDFHIKIIVEKQNMEKIKKDLINFFKQEYIIISNNDLPNFQNTVNWWDMDKNKIDICYFTSIIGKKHLFKSSQKSIEVWAFIVKQNDRTYFLYISYL